MKHALLLVLFASVSQIALSQNWLITGNSGTDPITNFLGTTDNKGLGLRTKNIERIRISTSGNTGIGLSNPQQKLDVKGNINIGSGFALHMENHRILHVDSANQNIFLGNGVAANNSTGFHNTVSGYNALFSNISGNGNVAIGIKALYNNVSRSNLVAVGDSALYNNGVGAEFSYVAIKNTAVGSKALYANTIGTNNTATGSQALYLNTTGGANTAVGAEALYSNTAGSNNNANGNQALYSNTSGGGNTATGAYSLYSNTTGTYNTANGLSALYYNTSGEYNTANGFVALNANTTGNYNTANGIAALTSNSTGGYNSANGASALYFNTTGLYNTANGAAALYNNSTGERNTANGYEALFSNTTGGLNTANGFFALYSNTVGAQNTADGYYALFQNNESYNTAVGSFTLYNTTAAHYNVALGYSAGDGYNNSHNNVFLGANTDVNGNGYFNVIAIGQGTVCTASNQVTIGNPATNSYRAYTTWSNISDGRYKKNMKDDVPGLKFINKLKPLTYTLDATAIDNFLHKNIPADKQMSAKAKAVHDKALKEKEQIRYTGFVAQDVEKAAREIGYDFSGVDAAKNENDLYGLRYAEFVVPLVKAVQELSKEVDDLKLQLNELTKNQNTNLGQSTTDGTLKISADQTAISLLGQNIPNPFDKSTIIPFRIPKGCKDATIVIAQSGSGKIIRAIPVSCGETQLSLDAGALSTGPYAYSLYVDGKLIDTKQMEHIK